MDYSRQIELAEDFLLAKHLSFVKPGKVNDLGNGVITVTFLKPEATDPTVVVDPPNEIVLVNLVTNEVSLAAQM